MAADVPPNNIVPALVMPIDVNPANNPPDGTFPIDACHAAAAEFAVIPPSPNPSVGSKYEPTIKLPQTHPPTKPLSFQTLDEQAVGLPHFRQVVGQFP